MSTDIKPGQVVTAVRDTRSAFSSDIDRGTRCVVKDPNYDGGKNSVAEAGYTLSVYRVGDSPKNTLLVKPADFEPTPAPLDPSKVKAGDTVTATGKTTAGGTYEITGEAWEPSHSHGSLWVGPVSLDATAVTLTAHQPAPKPEWKPGTSGTATLNNLVGGNAAVGMRVMRVIHADGSGSFVFENGTWVGDDATTWSVTDFVPDETRPLPTREQVAEVIRGRFGGALSAWYEDADAVLALVRGESR